MRDLPDQEVRVGQHLGHFARVQGERRCGHEAETVDQRDAKLASLEALRRALSGGPEGWRIGAERPLAAVADADPAGGAGREVVDRL